MSQFVTTLMHRIHQTVTMSHGLLTMDVTEANVSWVILQHIRERSERVNVLTAKYLSDSSFSRTANALRRISNVISIIIEILTQISACELRNQP